MKKETIKKLEEQSKLDFSYSLNETGDYRESWRIFRIMAEFVEGYQFLSKLSAEVTILGSARLPEDNKYYQEARKLAYILSENDFTVITGGGPGIMEAANRGAFEAGGPSIGLNIQLPFEQRINPFVKESTAFYYFLTRKVMLLSPAHAFVFFPGGFGTMDEFFEVVDLMEQGRLCDVPVVLVGKEYWQPIIDFLANKSMKMGAIKQEHLDRCHIVDDAKEAYKIIEQSKTIDTHCELSPKRFQAGNAIDWKIFRIMAELVEGFDFLTGMVNNVTVLGSRHISKDTHYYSVASEIAAELVADDFAIVTGGGTGLAEGANKGAKEAGGESIGIATKFNGNFAINDYLTRSLVMNFPFVRKLVVTAPSKAFVFFPGGFGTLHQLFEVLTLIQTKKMPPIPVILYDHEFWGPLHAFIKELFVHEFETVSDEDDELYTIVDSQESILRIIREFRKK